MPPNVQSSSGSQANQAVFFAAMKPGYLSGMSLAMGGHLTHGSPVNMSGKWFNVLSYGLNDKEEIVTAAPRGGIAREHRPK